MMSALVLAPDAPATADEDRAREVVVRSLGWLVSAVVAGVVVDVVLAAPPRFGLGKAADLVGCDLVEADGEGDRLRLGAAACRKDRLLVMRSGFAADASMVDELDAFLRGRTGPAMVQATPETSLQRMMPRFAPVAGLVLPRETVLRASRFEDLVRSTRRDPHLRGRAVRLSSFS